MKLNSHKKTASLSQQAFSSLSWLKNRSWFKRVLIILSGLFVLLCFAFLAVVYSTYSYAMPYLTDRLYRQFIDTALVPTHFFSSFIHPLFHTPLETVYLDVPFKDWQNIQSSAMEAQKVGIFVSEDNDWMKADFSSSLGKTYKTKIRPKGDWADHLDLDKLSLRIELKNGKAWNGLTTFSLQSPATRHHLGEWLLLKVLRDENILAPRYDFVNATMNGRSMGVMAIEEFFTKELVENMGRRESVIFKYDESMLWDDRIQHINVLEKDNIASTLIFGRHNVLNNPAPFDSFGLNDTMEDPQKKLLAQSAFALLEDFDQERKSFCQVFDCEQYARYFAIQNLFGGEHGNFWHNERFYYNPITSYFEPVSFDNYAGERSTGVLLGLSKEFRGLIDYALVDPAFSSLYQAELWRVSQPEYIESFWAAYESQLKFFQGFLWREFPTFSIRTLRNTIESNAYGMRSLFNTSTYLNARFEITPSLDYDEIEVQLGNFVPLELELQLIEANGIPYSPNEWTRCGTNHPIGSMTLRPTFHNDAPHYQSVCLTVLHSDLAIDLKVHLKVSGSGQRTTVTASPLVPRLTEERLSESDENVGSFPFIVKDEIQKTLTFPQGTWELSRDLIIPSGYTVLAKPGTNLRLAPGVSVFSYSSFKFEGTSAEPVRIEALDPKQPWKVFMVFNSKTPSVLHHVDLSGGSQRVNGVYNLPAAIAFFRNDVEMSDVSIHDMHGEDALNVIEAKFNFKNMNFARTSSDAFDSDFSHGTINDATFLDIGDDAIDVSGTTIRIDHLIVRGAGDKGVSVGEGSTATLNDAVISDAFIGLTSKDLSSLTASDVLFSNTYFALTAYTKKQAFGPATLSVVTDQIFSSDQSVVQEGSSVIVNDTPFPVNRSTDHDVFAEFVETNPNL